MEYPPIEAIAARIERQYLFPEIGKKLATTLRNTNFEISSELELAEKITAMLIQESGDKHFFLRYTPDELAGQADHAAVMQAKGEHARLRNFGYRILEVLEGNIGYWHLMELAPPFAVSDLFKSALVYFANVHALILDKRGGRGGTPEMVQLLASQFLEPDKALSGIESPEAGYQQARTLDNAQNFLTIPLYILIDGETFSGCEALVYDLQAHKRATIFGKRSKGGAHLSDFIPFEEKWLLRLPIARALNPITNGNWEGHGILPDIETDTPKEDAWRLALENLIRLNSEAIHLTLWDTALKSLKQS
jgi:retinol-binding protein 3